MTETIIQGFIGFIVTIALYFLTAYFRAKIEAIKDERARALAEIAVLAIEQTVKDMHGKLKYAAAETEFRALLEERGINVDDAAIKALIESAVKRMNDGVLSDG